MIYQVTKLIFLFQFTKFSMHWNKKNVCFCFLFTYKRDYNKIRITEHLVRNTCEQLRNIGKILKFWRHSTYKSSHIMFLSRAFYIVTAIILNVKSYHITTKNFSLLGEFLLPPLQYIKKCPDLLSGHFFEYIFDVYECCIRHGNRGSYIQHSILLSHKLAAGIYTQEDKQEECESPQGRTSITEERQWDAYHWRQS